MAQIVSPNGSNRALNPNRDCNLPITGDLFALHRVNESD